MIVYPDWSDKSILILGFGAEGRANLKYAARCGAREIALADQNPSLHLNSDDSALIKRRFIGEDYLAGPTDFDLVIRSPGVSLRYITELKSNTRKALFTSGTQIFLEQHHPRTIAVTGTKGKSTTASLIQHILQVAGINSELGGNIGIPALNLLEKPADTFVLELSSYQLTDIKTSPHVAVFLNLYPEHLDQHGSFELYGQAKSNIARYQKHGDVLILPTDNPLLNELTKTSSAIRSYWGSPESGCWTDDGFFYYRCNQGTIHKLCAISDLKLKGPGNHRNILAALTAVRDFSIPPKTLTLAISSFEPLPHRLENVGVVNQVTYINDSISTVPEATINALETFGSAVSTIILGGFDRGVSFTGLANYLMKTSVKTIILFPPSGSRIAQDIRSNELFSANERELIEVNSMKTAIKLASRESPPESVCLLSPASPSFPLFKNFEERGAAFRAAVKEISLNERWSPEPQD